MDNDIMNLWLPSCYVKRPRASLGSPNAYWYWTQCVHISATSQKITSKPQIPSLLLSPEAWRRFCTLSTYPSTNASSQRCRRCGRAGCQLERRATRHPAVWGEHPTKPCHGVCQLVKDAWAAVSLRHHQWVRNFKLRLSMPHWKMKKLHLMHPLSLTLAALFLSDSESSDFECFDSDADKRCA